MLRLIRIRNLALIRELEIEFGRGLNMLTGETGSGKSILIDALGLLLGARSSSEMIRTDCESAAIEGMFEIDSCASANRILNESGFESEDGSLLIRREIFTSGRSRVFINDHLSSVSMLRNLGEALADIHGQQEQRTLLDLETHLEWLDDFGGNTLLVKDVEDSFKRLKAIASRLESMEMDEQERLRKIDMLQFQIEEIRQVDPKPGEKETLEDEQNVLANREKIIALATEAHEMLHEDESSILRRLGHVEKLLDQLERFDKSWLQQREILQDCKYKIEDISYAARDYLAGSEFSPDRLEQVQQRLYALDKLTRKYGASNSDILGYLDNCARELDVLLSFSESSARLSELLHEELKIYRQLADTLSAKRQEDANRLESEIKREFAALAMEKMELSVHFLPNKEPAGSHIPSFYGRDGIDNVEFLIAPNKGEEMKPLAKIASGGELSRLMLSIETVCGCGDPDRTLVFDEVDAGIGGRAAEAVAKRLKALSVDNQTLCVTHLPQLAAFADHHFNVSKTVINERTETIAKHLSESARIDELSRMLGGEKITPADRRFASELLQRSASNVVKV
jgi:DNA repair protein RecN (Recombination protein N)